MNTNTEETPTVSPEEIPITPHLQPPNEVPAFDLDAISLPQNFAGLAEVTSNAVAIPIHKPVKQIWFSPHAHQKAWKAFLIFRDETDHDKNYVIAPSLKDSLEGEWTAKILVPCITRQGSVFFWPVKLPDVAGKLDPWNRSALEIATSNGGQWIRLKSNPETSAYEVVKPVSPLPPPEWPTDLNVIYQKAVAAVLINNLNHPLAKRLRGDI